MSKTIESQIKGTEKLRVKKLTKIKIFGLISSAQRRLLSKE